MNRSRVSAEMKASVWLLILGLAGTARGFTPLAHRHVHRRAAPGPRHAPTFPSPLTVASSSTSDGGGGGGVDVNLLITKLNDAVAREDYRAASQLKKELEALREQTAVDSGEEAKTGAQVGMRYQLVELERLRCGTNPRAPPSGCVLLEMLLLPPLHCLRPASLSHPGCSALHCGPR